MTEAERQVDLSMSVGGIQFRCTGCGTEGLIDGSNPIAVSTRLTTGIQAPNPVGIEVETCHLCPQKTCPESSDSA